MAVSIRSQDVREKVIKEGTLRYRQSSLYLQRWKPRYVVFKITHSGRLQLIIYKEQPAIPMNEIKEVPIDEFGGLESNLSLDNEKYAFAIITTHVTESFSVESPREMTEWTTLLQEYLGKELVLNIYIPSKQNCLKSGHAQLRVRNTGFTITTCDNPPRCQGTWQIIHIRKYGGSDSFRFQTGSRCPTGEFLYSIQTDDNVRLKSLFNDLSQHRPIFTDDRVGRRMTLERSFNHKVGLHARVANRYSLQQQSDHDHQRVYQNHEAFANKNRHNSADTVGETSGRRHSAVDVDISNPHTKQLPADHAQTSSNSVLPNSSDDTSSRQYQNVNRLPHHGRTSPTKRVQHTVMKPLPEKYYSVAPPQALKKYRTSINSTPPSSPEDDLRTELAVDVNIPVTEHEEYEQNESYVDISNTELSVKVVGDSLVVHIPPSSPIRNAGRNILPPPVAEAGYYQNLAFMQGNSRVPPPTEETDGSSRKVFSTAHTSEDDVSSQDVEGSAHNYTNVEFAHEQAGLTPRKVKEKLSKDNWSHVPNHGSSPKTRKISAPSGPSNKPSKTSSIEALTSSLELPFPSLRNSHSNYELNKAGIEGSSTSPKNPDENQAVFDYYNILVPHLPANSSITGQDIGLRNKFSGPGYCSKHKQLMRDVDIRGAGGDQSNTEDSRGIQAENQSDNIVHHQSTHAKLDKVDDAAQTSNKHTSLPLSDVSSDEPNPTKTQCLSPVHPHDSSHHSNYDTLNPIVGRDSTPSNSSPQPLYDSLLPKSEARSSSSSPEPCSYSPSHLNKTYQYSRKMQLLQHGHKYEYIDVELPQSDRIESHHRKRESSSPVRKEHPSSWMAGHLGQDEKNISAGRTLPSISSRRKKQLPLQDSPIDIERHSVVNGNKDGVRELFPSARISAPQLPHKSYDDSTCESPRSPRKPQPLPRRGMHSQQLNNEWVSSIDSYISQQDIYPAPSGHFDGVDNPTKSDCHHAREFSPLRRLAHEVVTPKIKSVHVELANEQQDCDSFNLVLPQKQILSNYSSGDSRPSSPSPIPILPPRSSVESKNLNDHVQPSPTAQRLSEPGIKLPLPQKEIHFHPPVPPKPRVLCPPPDSNALQKYVTVSFGGAPVAGSSEYHEVLVHPSTSAMPTVQQGNNGDSSGERVEYTLVDFKMTYGLGKTIEQVEDRRRGFPDTRQ